MATNYPDLLPVAVAREVIQSVTQRESALMRLARVIRMPTGVQKVPVITGMPAAGFVNPTYGGLKPEGAVDWAPETLTAAEIGTVIPVPNAYIDDSAFDVEGSVREEIARSFAGVFERAALYGTNAPADWPAGGLTAAANADATTGADALKALDAALSNLEAKGITPDGILGGAALRAALRAQMVDVMQPFSEAPAQVYGVPVVFDSYWNDATGLALVGGFGSVLVGVREDLTYARSEEGVITDGAGAVVYNALQQDGVILRCYWRIALAQATPLGAAGTAVKPLALAKVGVAARRGSS
jgi:HK97 family phage major capsid protein